MQFADELIARLADAVAERVIKLTASPKRLLDVPDAAVYLGRSQGAIRQLIGRGVIPTTKIDGKTQIDRIALDKIISEATYFES